VGEIVRGRPADGRELERTYPRRRTHSGWGTDENSQYSGSGSVYLMFARSSVDDGTCITQQSKQLSSTLNSYARARTRWTGDGMRTRKCGLKRVANV